MMRIEGVRIRNFRALGDIALGRLRDRQDMAPLLPLTVIIGRNGVGKTSLIDAFCFVSDCLHTGVEDACSKRGGFSRICTQGRDLIGIEIDFKENADGPSCTYEIEIKAMGGNDQPYVRKELLVQDGAKKEFLCLEDGSGFARTETEANTPTEEAENSLLVKLDNNSTLGLSVFGALGKYEKIASFRRFVDGWYFSRFTPDAARNIPMSGPQKKLNPTSDNLNNVVQFMEQKEPGHFHDILSRLARSIPGFQKIDTKRTSDGRLLLQFYKEGLERPLYADQMSDGTLKLLAYLLLLEDPSLNTLLFLEEPENTLHHKLLELLVEAMRKRAETGAQIFVTTHNPYFLDAVAPQEVWVLQHGCLQHGEQSAPSIHRASDDELVKNLADEGLPLGGLWSSDYLDDEGRDDVR